MIVLPREPFTNTVVWSFAGFGYTKEELDAWAPKSIFTKESIEKDVIRWQKISPFVVCENSIPVGFGELEEEGHINCFFVDPQYQGKGIGAMLMKGIKSEAKKLGYDKIVAEVSITAKDFFLKHGFMAVKPILCDISGLKMKYYLMEFSFTEQ